MRRNYLNLTPRKHGNPIQGGRGKEECVDMNELTVNTNGNVIKRKVLPVAGFKAHSRSLYTKE